MCKAPSRAVQRPFGGSAPTPTLIRWHSNPVTGNPQRHMDNPNPNPLEEKELVITDLVLATGTAKPWSDITNVPNTGTVNPIAIARATLSLTHVPSTLQGQPHCQHTDDLIHGTSTLQGQPHCRHTDDLIYNARTFNTAWASSSLAHRGTHRQLWRPRPQRRHCRHRQLQLYRLR